MTAPPTVPSSAPPQNKPATAAKSAEAPAAAATPAAKPPPQPAKPPIPPKKKGGCLPKLILLLIIGGGLAALIYFPQQIESLTGVKLPAFIHSLTASPAADESADDEAPAAPAAPGSQAPAPSDLLDTRIQQLQQTADSNRQTLQSLQARLMRSEQQSSRLAAQVADINRQQTDRLLQLQIIDLQLQLSGDTAAAAKQLKQLAATSQDTTLARALMDEAARLDNLPRRALLLSLLNELKTPPPPAADKTDSRIGRLLKDFLNIRYTPTAAATSAAQEQLAQLELLLLTRQEAAYWLRLQQLHDDDIGDQEVQAILQRLYEYGAPDYRLALPQVRG